MDPLLRSGNQSTRQSRKVSNIVSGGGDVTVSQRVLPKFTQSPATLVGAAVRYWTRGGYESIAEIDQHTSPLVCASMTLLTSHCRGQGVHG